MKTRTWMSIVALGCALSTVMTESAIADSGAPAHYQKSYDSEATGAWSDALAAMDALSSADKSTYVAELRRGYLLYKLGRHAESVESYARASTLAPGSVEARIGALAPLIALRRWLDVEKTATAALKLDPASYLGNIRLAYAYYNLARYDEAAAIYRKLMDLYPSDVDARTGLGWALLKKGKAADAVKEFRAVLEFAPKNALARDGLVAAGVTS